MHKIILLLMCRINHTAITDAQVWNHHLPPLCGVYVAYLSSSMQDIAMIIYHPGAVMKLNSRYLFNNCSNVLHDFFILNFKLNLTPASEVYITHIHIYIYICMCIFNILCKHNFPNAYHIHIYIESDSESKSLKY